MEVTRNPPRRIDARLKCVLLAALLAAVPGLFAQDVRVDWWTIDGGGELVAEGGPWTLSGTIGQWDASVTAPQAGGDWTLTGGFWVVTQVGETEPPGEFIFADGFESPPP